MADYLSEPAEWKGHFWPAEDQAQARPGVLSYKPDTGIRLHLIGGFNDAKWVPAPGGVGRVLTTPTREWPVVHGVAAKVPITLLDCIFQRGSRKGFGPELDEQEIRAEPALVGIHLSDGSSPSFTGIAIELENLTAWAFDSDITLKIGANQSGQRRWAIEVEQTVSRFAHLNGMKAELSRGHVLIQDDRRRSHLNVATREISSILFGSKQPRPLSDWLQMVDLLQDLISLAMDTPCAVLSQIVSPSDEANNDPDAQARTEVPVYTQGILAAQPGEDAVRAYEALFTLNDRGFDVVLPRWVFVQKRFTMACHMVLGLRYINRGYLETQLMTAVGAAEVFHRQLFKAPPIPEEEFAEMKRRILERVPATRQQWVQSRLWNEPSLKGAPSRFGDSARPRSYESVGTQS